jgi:glucose-1-phosphate adenylyltransferase
MDLLGEQPAFNHYDRSWRIFFRNNPLPPHFAGKSSFIENSIVTEGCIVNGLVKDSVIFNSVKIGKGARVVDSIVLPGAVIEDGASVEYSIIDSGAVISAGVKIGENKETAKGITVIGTNLVITKEHEIEVGAMVNAASLKA